jgi:hypothetical protein
MSDTEKQDDKDDNEKSCSNCSAPYMNECNLAMECDENFSMWSKKCSH